MRLATSNKPTIGIVGGRGTLGQIFARAFRAIGLPVLISGRKPDGKKVLANRTLSAKADIIIVSVFLKDSLKVIQEIAPLLTPQQLFCDFTSLKVEPVKALLKSQAAVIGLHPMFGFVENLQGQNIFLCPVRAKNWLPLWRKILTQIGLNIHLITPQKHDELAAIHQNLLHTLLIAFARLLQQKHLKPATLFQCSSPSTKLNLLLAGRILAQDSALYSDLHSLNPAAPKTETKFLEIFQHLQKSNRTQFKKAFESAAQFFGPFRKFAFAETTQIFSSKPVKLKRLQQKKSLLRTPEPPQQNSPPLKPMAFGGAQNTRLKIALLGPGTQSELAAAQLLSQTKLKAQPTWQSDNLAIFQALQEKKADLGLVPFENSSVGLVRPTLQNLFAAQNTIQIIGEIKLKVQHALLGLKKTKKIHRIFAHPQAQAQVSKFLFNNFPTATIIEMPSASAALNAALKDPHSFAIGPREAAQNSALKIIHTNLEDAADNQTRFILIIPTAAKPPAEIKLPKPQKTALAFYFPKNQAGQLARALAIFAKFKINLSRLESIPTTKKRGEFFFFVECESPATQTAAKKLREIAHVVNFGKY